MNSDSPRQSNITHAHLNRDPQKSPNPNNWSYWNKSNLLLEYIYLLWFNFVFGLNFFLTSLNFLKCIFLIDIVKKGFIFFGAVVKKTGARLFRVS